MVETRFYLPTRIVTGSAVIDQAFSATDGRIGKRALLITETDTTDSGIAESVRARLDTAGCFTVGFNEVEIGSMSSVAERAVRIARSSHVESVVSLGSAGTTGLAKLVSTMMRSDQDADDILDGTPPSGDPSPLLVIPTEPFDPLLLTGSIACIDARNRVLRYIDVSALPIAAMFDGEILHRATGMSVRYNVVAAMLTAIEGMFSRRRSFLTTPCHFASIEHASRYLRADTGENPTGELRATALHSGILSALGASRTGIGLGSALCLAAAARSGINPFALSSSIIAPTVAVLARSAPRTAGTIAKCMGFGSDEASAEFLDESIRKLLGPIGVPLRLRDLDYSEDDFSGIGGVVEDMGVMANYAGGLTTEDIEELISSAL